MGFLQLHIESMLSYLEKLERSYSIAFANAPPGTLIHHNRRGHYEYFHSVPTDDKPKKYIRKGITRNREIIAALADKEYSRRVLMIVRENLRHLYSLKTKLVDIDVDQIMCSMKSPYRTLPEDCFSVMKNPGTRRAQLRQWADEEYEMSDYMPERKNKKTSRGLLVRSRAELLICEKCYELDIPFRYEQVLRIGKYELAPDFTFRDSQGEEFYMEYCGMMDDMDYVKRYLWKLDQYHRAGIFEWDNLIFIFDRDNEIDMDRIMRTIHHEVQPRL